MAGSILVPRVVDLQTAQVIASDNAAEAAAYPTIQTGAGTPTATSSVPTKAGDIYIDTTNHKIYIAEKVTPAVGDFLILN